nr:hypothetical protein [Tanacetum cinerariifolium]
MYQDAMNERQTLSCVENISKSNDDMARKYTHSNTVQHAECFKQKMLLVQLQEAGIQLSKVQLAILADTGERIDFGPSAFTVTTNALFQVDGVEGYDSDYDDVPNSQPSFMANISSYGFDVLAESSDVNHSEIEITSDSNIIPFSVPKELPKVSMVNTSLKKLKHHLAGFDMVFKERTMPTAITEGSWRPIKVKVPKELPKVSMVNTSLKKLKHHLAGFDMVFKERTMPTAITEGSWGFEHTKACFRVEIIPFVKDLKDLFNKFDQYLLDELSEVQNVFHQME